MASNTEAIHTTAGNDFVIDLDSNPTTGYRWIPKYDPFYVELTADEVIHESKLMGAGGIQRFSFHTLKSGETEIEMMYKRHWEKEPLRERKFAVSIN